MLLLAVTVVLFIKDKIEVGQSCCVVTSLVSFSSRSPLRWHVHEASLLPASACLTLLSSLILPCVPHLLLFFLGLFLCKFVPPFLSQPEIPCPH